MFLKKPPKDENFLEEKLSPNEADIDAVWEKGEIIDGVDSSQFRKDKCGLKIEHKYYGNTDEKTGWEIDHIKPIAKGGLDKLDNLQPLQWENNRSKSDNYPKWNCANNSVACK